MTMHCSMFTRKKERPRSPSLAACIKERALVLKGRAPPHRPRGSASTEVYSSKLAPTMGPTTQLSPGRQALQIKTHSKALSMPSNIPACSLG
eukprot:1153467-Pelagomonas_calceolata.AAC.2